MGIGSRILRLVIALGLLFLGRPLPALAPALPASLATRRIEDLNRTVYITRTGKRYHGPNCRYLRSSKIPIKLKDALANGYTACHVCGGR